MSWIYPAKSFPAEVRAFGNSIVTFTNWLINLTFARLSPEALSSKGFGCFYVLFVFNIIAIICYFVSFPETKGYTLEHMDELFGDALVPHAQKDPTGVKLRRRRWLFQLSSKKQAGSERAGSERADCAQKMLELIENLHE